MPANHGARPRLFVAWRAALGAAVLSLAACASSPLDSPQDLAQDLPQDPPQATEPTAQTAPDSSTAGLAAQAAPAASAATQTVVSAAEPLAPEITSATPLPLTGHWEGRLSLKLGAFGQAASTGSQMAFELDVKDNQGTLSLSTPLGTRMAMVRWQALAMPGQATAQLETAEGMETFESLESLTQQLLGEALPLQAMLHWLSGTPSPALPHEAAQGQPSATPRAFGQAGWQVDATALQEGKLNAFRAETPTQRSVTLRLRLDL